VCRDQTKGGKGGDALGEQGYHLALSHRSKEVVSVNGFPSFPQDQQLCVRGLFCNKHLLASRTSRSDPQPSDVLCSQTVHAAAHIHSTFIMYTHCPAASHTWGLGSPLSISGGE
jgi:hypothetical protein